MHTKNEKIKIGKIVNAVALRGEVKVYNYSDYKERYEELEYIIADEKEYKIEKVRYMQNMVILKLEGVNDRNQAEALKNKEVYIREDELRVLPEDTFYIKDLVGLDVVLLRDGTKVGVLEDVIQNRAQDIYQVRLENGEEALIPAVKEFVKEVSMEKRQILITPIPGMIDSSSVIEGSAPHASKTAPCNSKMAGTSEET